MKICQSGMSNFHIDQGLWYYADRPTPCVDNGIGDCTHQPYTGTTVDQSQIPLGQCATQTGRLLPVTFAGPIMRTAEHTDTLQIIPLSIQVWQKLGCMCSVDPILPGSRQYF